MRRLVGNAAFAHIALCQKVNSDRIHTQRLFRNLSTDEDASISRLDCPCATKVHNSFCANVVNPVK